MPRLEDLRCSSEPAVTSSSDFPTGICGRDVAPKRTFVNSLTQHGSPAEFVPVVQQSAAATHRSATRRRSVRRLSTDRRTVGDNLRICTDRRSTRCRGRIRHSLQTTSKGFLQKVSCPLLITLELQQRGSLRGLRSREQLLVREHFMRRTMARRLGWAFCAHAACCTRQTREDVLRVCVRVNLCPCAYKDGKRVMCAPV